jgi:hypothetical protein
MAARGIRGWGDYPSWSLTDAAAALDPAEPRGSRDFTAVALEELLSCGTIFMWQAFSSSMTIRTFGRQSARS